MRVDQVFSVVFSKNPVGWQTSSCEVDEVGDAFGDTSGDTFNKTSTKLGYDYWHIMKCSILVIEKHLTFIGR